MTEYTHSALSLDGPAIRLFRLHKGSGRSITGELFQAHLHQRGDAVSYEALSYTWGPPDVREDISIDGQCLSVTVNLYLALQQLRQRDEDRILWIDATCIDQKNLKERGHQVQQMGDIYKQADRVLFWLGAATDATDVFLKSMQLLHRLSLRYPCKSWSLDDSRWEDLWKDVQIQLNAYHGNSNLENLQRKGLEILLDRPWFRRVWILQEVANAKSALLYCGTQSVSVRVLGIAPILLGVEPNPHCQAVLDIMPGIWRESSWWSQSHSLYTLLKMFGSSEATESRDLLYALRGISSDASEPDILPPDYEKSEQQVAIDAIRFLCGCDLDDYDDDERRSLPTDIRSLAEGLDSLTYHSCLALAKLSKTEKLEFLLRRPETQIGRHLVNTVFLNDPNGEMTQLLFQCRGIDVEITEEGLAEAAKNETAAEEVMTAILQHKTHSTKITTEVLLAAASNTGCGEKVLKLLL
ncbi:HET-domain-containing protein, partial [Trichoderma reesei RUT C-30]